MRFFFPFLFTVVSANSLPWEYNLKGHQCWLKRSSCLILVIQIKTEQKGKAKWLSGGFEVQLEIQSLFFLFFSFSASWSSCLKWDRSNGVYPRTSTLSVISILCSRLSWWPKNGEKHLLCVVVIEWPWVCLLLSNSETMCWWIWGLWFLRLKFFSNVQQPQIKTPPRLEHPLLSDVLSVFPFFL